MGVSPILFYDPLERVVATLHPNDTWDKVVFDAWREVSYDGSDTVVNADGSTDPQSDPDVKAFFSRLPDADGFHSWYEQRIALPVDHPERIAAGKAAIHRQTPTITHLDTLGRPFLTVAHNRFTRSDAIVEEKYRTRIELDIKGQQRAVRDAVVQAADVLGRIVVRHEFDMLGGRIHQTSMDAGERWMLNDVTGRPIRTWDSRGHDFETVYDRLRRPIEQYVRGTATARSDPRTLGPDLLFEKTEYGEDQQDDRALNLRTRVFKSHDGAGLVTSASYDFKGNLLESRRQVAVDYTTIPDWAASVELEEGGYETHTEYDALNRATRITSPDSSTYRPTYNEGNLLDKVDVNLRGVKEGVEPVWTPFVTNIDHNAKGQRTRIRYANGVETTYEYDPNTHRLVHLRTTRGPGANGLAPIFNDPTVVQDLRYTYDPVGNITRIDDGALRTIIRDNQEVAPLCEYSYDALFRLIEATGREHIGQTVFDFEPPDRRFRDYPLSGPSAHPHDLQALRTYTETYEYDEVGNFTTVTHHAGPGSWTRGYACDAASLIEATKPSNRLTATTIGQRIETYAHDDHGNMSAMPHLPVMRWDFKDQLQASSTQVNDTGVPETTFYVYDAAGLRLRKVAETSSGTTRSERLYLAGFEIYRVFEGADAGVERQTLHVLDERQRIALVETKTVEQNIPIVGQIPLLRYQLSNHLGSASLELDGTGAFVSYERNFTPSARQDYR